MKPTWLRLPRHRGCRDLQTSGFCIYRSFEGVTASVCAPSGKTTTETAPYFFSLLFGETCANGQCNHTFIRLVKTIMYIYKNLNSHVDETLSQTLKTNLWKKCWSNNVYKVCGWVCVCVCPLCVCAPLSTLTSNNESFYKRLEHFVTHLCRSSSQQLDSPPSHLERVSSQEPQLLERIKRKGGVGEAP